MANLDPASALALAATAHIARGAKPGLLLKPINALSLPYLNHTFWKIK